MKKKTLLVTLLLLLLGAVGWLGSQTYSRLSQKKRAEANLQTLPLNTQLTTTDSTQTTLGEVLKNSPHPSGEGLGAVIFFFDPSCEHCQAEATEIIKYAKRFEGINVVWVSMAQLHRIREFEQGPALQKALPQLRIMGISPQEADEQFGFRTVPTILIYNAQGHLTKKYIGETKIEAILKHL